MLHLYGSENIRFHILTNINRINIRSVYNKIFITIDIVKEGGMSTNMVRNNRFHLTYLLILLNLILNS